MARPKISETKKKVKLNITVSPTAKAKAEQLASDAGISVSQYVENLIMAKGRRKPKAEKIEPIEPIKGQTTIDEFFSDEVLDPVKSKFDADFDKLEQEQEVKQMLLDISKQF